MNLHPYGDRALLLQLGSLDDVIAWATAIDRADIAGIEDITPGAETVVVSLTDTEVAPTVSEALNALHPGTDTLPGVDDQLGELIEIPVTYDGPDLDDVAALTHMSREQVIAAHTGTDWNVGFGGFAPGFAYLVGGDRHLKVPRRQTARTRVPAGAVGLAATFSGIYPRESPGGWQLIGSTDVALWDLDRDPPALLRTGMRVRFTVAD